MFSESNNKRRCFFTVVYPQQETTWKGLLDWRCKYPPQESHRKVRDPILKRERCRVFLKERIFSEIVKSSNIVKVYSNSVQFQSIASDNYTTSETLPLLQWLQYSQQCHQSFTASDLSRQQRSKYWSYRGSLDTFHSI
jgi:hypothetical protein